MLYFLTILIAMLLVETASITVSLVTGSMTLTYAIFMPIFVNFYVLVVLGIIALLMRMVIPRKAWNAQKKCFKVSKKEIVFFNKVNIKAWKDKVPEMGHTSGFPKTKIRSLEKDYLWKFLEETCYAEVMHYVVAVLGFTVLFFLKVSDYAFAFPILIVNLILHVLPSLIQRFNRYRLLQVYEIVVKRDKGGELTKV